MKKRLSNFFEYIIERMPLKYSVPLSIISVVVLTIIYIQPVSFPMILMLLISIFFATLFISNIFRKYLLKDISKRNIKSLERLKKKLTNEFQVVSLKCEDDFIKEFAGNKALFVFKAKIENDTVYYKFETKDGETLGDGETRDFEWFEEKIL